LGSALGEGTTSWAISSIRPTLLAKGLTDSTLDWDTLETLAQNNPKLSSTLSYIIDDMIQNTSDTFAQKVAGAMFGEADTNGLRDTNNNSAISQSESRSQMDLYDTLLALQALKFELSMPSPKRLYGRPSN
jgi:hypothetical protein